MSCPDCSHEVCAEEDRRSQAAIDDLKDQVRNLTRNVARQHSMLNEALANVLKLAQELERSRKEIRDLKDGKGSSTTGELRAKSTVSR